MNASTTLSNSSARTEGLELGSDLEQPGGLLAELEARQDEALADLEVLERRLEQVLHGLGVSPVVAGGEVATAEDARGTCGGSAVPMSEAA